MPANFDELKASLTNEHHNFLNHLWDKAKENRRWDSVLSVYSHFDKPNVDPVIKSLGGNVVYIEDDHSRDSTTEVFCLTFLGLLLTKDGDHIRDLVVRYCKYLRDIFKKNPDGRISAEDIRKSLNIEGEDLKFLGRLHLNSSIYWSGFCESDEWLNNYPKDIAEYCRISDFEKHINDVAYADYDPNYPLRNDERIAFSMRKRYSPIEAKNDFEFIQDPQIRKIAEDDWCEIEKVFEVGAWKSCLILCGSVFEAILIGLLSNDIETANKYYEDICNKVKPIAEWNLTNLFNVAEKMGVIHGANLHLGRVVREYRNLIHPGKMVREHYDINKEQAEIAKNSIKITLDRISKLSK